MSSPTNKPTGLGFQGSPYRRCENCGHSEQLHFGSVCGGPVLDQEGPLECPCRSFCARPLSATEKRIIEEQLRAASERELEYVGEALYRELKRESPSATREEQRS